MERELAKFLVGIAVGWAVVIILYFVDNYKRNKNK